MVVSEAGDAVGEGPAERHAVLHLASGVAALAVGDKALVPAGNIGMAWTMRVFVLLRQRRVVNVTERSRLSARADVTAEVPRAESCQAKGQDSGH